MLVNIFKLRIIDQVLNVVFALMVVLFIANTKSISDDTIKFTGPNYIFIKEIDLKRFDNELDSKLAIMSKQSLKSTANIIQQVNIDKSASILSDAKYSVGDMGLPSPSNYHEIIKSVRLDISQTLKRPIKINSYAESLPLIPMFNAAGVQLPVELKVAYEQMGYNFYLVEVRFSYLPSESDLFLSFVEFNLVLEDDMKDPMRHVRPISLFPDRKDVEYFSVDLAGKIGVDARMDISRNIKYVSGALTGEGGVKIVAGPFNFSYRNAAIEVTGTSDQEITWRYNLKSALCDKNEFSQFLILKIPKEANKLKLIARLSAIQCKKSWMSILWGTNTKLPAYECQQILQVELMRKE